MWELPYNTALVLTGTTFIGMTAGLVGTFAVLRRRALTGDALAHAALPGVCLGYFAAGGQSLPFQFLGAFLTGLLAVWVIRILPRISKTRTETAVAGVLSVFFGVGIVFSKVIQNSGQFGGRAGLDAFLFGAPASLLFQDVVLIGITCLLTIVLILATYRLSVGVAFDSGFLEVLGLPTRQIDWLHLLLLAMTVVVGLPAIGVVMIVALIITPAATARLWSDRLPRILIISAMVGAGSAAFGGWLSSQAAQVPAGAATVLCCSLCFLVSLAVTSISEHFPAQDKSAISMWRSKSASSE